jgi:hypothetical protein
MQADVLVKSEGLFTGIMGCRRGCSVQGPMEGKYIPDKVLISKMFWDAK